LRKQIQEMDVQLEQAKRDRDRLENLLKEGLIPKQKFEQADTSYRSLLMRKKALEDHLKELRAVYSKAQGEFERAQLDRLRVQELKKQVSSLEEEIKALRAQIQKAQLDLQRTELRSPVDGVVAKRFISVGDMVRPGQPAFSLVDDSSLFAEALLEETKLRGIKQGSKAYIRLDAYKGVVFEGVVEEISPASAATFALVPRDISAGEFTKVVQRIPVKIKITKGDMSLLRVGMGGRVEIRRE
ncbi:MAG: HlyD family efflux transporter periplasmic adaptor subunit, partial [Aquificaceae bacterium]